MNENGDDRRLVLEQGVGAAAPHAEVARALKADPAAGFEPLTPFLGLTSFCAFFVQFLKTGCSLLQVAWPSLL